MKTVGRLKGFMNSNRLRVYHFVAILVLGLVFLFLLDFGSIDQSSMTIIHYFMYSYLLLILILPLLVSILVTVVFHVIFFILKIVLSFINVTIDPLFGFILQYITPLVLIVSTIYLVWSISGLFVDLKHRNIKLRKFLMHSIPWIIMALIFGIVLMQLGVYKPVVYLYPPEDMDVEVRVDINGRITKSIPDYGDMWCVHATKEGLIDSRYNYLFYEASLNRLDRPKTGWVVEYNNLSNWFDEKLPELGLNKAEAEEFKEYWINKLPESRYYQIGLLSDEFLETDMDLIVEPKPDTVIRLIFYFKPLDERVDIPELIIHKKERLGFTVVEWGGIMDLPLLDRILLNLGNLNPFIE